VIHYAQIDGQYFPDRGFSGIEEYVWWFECSRGLHHTVRAPIEFRHLYEEPDRPSRYVDWRTRAEVLSSSRGLCFYCSGELDFDDWHLEHKNPISRGGSSERFNLVASCPSCNNKKRALTADEFLAKIATLENRRAVLQPKIEEQRMRLAK